MVSWVLIHPGESWTALGGVLGNDDDPVYKRVRRHPVPGGDILKLKARRAAPSRPAAPAPPFEADVVVFGARPCHREPRRWFVTLREGGGRARRVACEVLSPSLSLGRVEAVGQVVAGLQGASVAVRAWPFLEHVLGGEASPTHVGLHQARENMWRGFKWGSKSGWWLGEPA